MWAMASRPFAGDFVPHKTMRILLVTPYFPSLDIPRADLRTRYLYYFAKSWIALGCEVMVLHSVPQYPRILARAFPWIERRMGFTGLYEGRAGQHPEAVGLSEYQIDGLMVIRTPIVKLFPHREYATVTLRRHVMQVLNRLRNAGFHADITISDFLTPSIHIASEIQSLFAIPFHQILHLTDWYYLIKYEGKYRNLLSRAAGALYRSASLAALFRSRGIAFAEEGYIFSGIPDETIFGPKRRTVRSLVFVGSLQKRKKVNVILEALAISKSRDQFTLEIIGAGPCEKHLKRLARKLGLQQRIHFCGRLPRETVFERLHAADCFVMVSQDTFGIAYIEALSQGCIVVAGKSQGVDGILRHGHNGFLVELGDSQKLADLLDSLSRLPPDDIEGISENALLTAKGMTNGGLAEEILNRLQASAVVQAKRAAGGPGATSVPSKAD